MKKYYKWKATGCFYCVIFHKNGHIKEAVAVETIDEQNIEHIAGKDFSQSYLEQHCQPITRDEFMDAYNHVEFLIDEAMI